MIQKVLFSANMATDRKYIPLGCIFEKPAYSADIIPLLELLRAHYGDTWSYSLNKLVIKSLR